LIEQEQKASFVLAADRLGVRLAVHLRALAMV
jgi:hypothetical protein